MLRDAGFEVIYTGLFQTPDTVAAAAVDEDVDAIGLSMLSGAHMTLAPKVVEKVRERGVDIPVIVGGIIPEPDVPLLTTQGVAAVLTPGATADDVVQGGARRHRALTGGRRRPPRRPSRRARDRSARAPHQPGGAPAGDPPPADPGRDHPRAAAASTPRRTRPVARRSNGTSGSSGTRVCRWSRRSSAATRPVPPATGSTSRATPCRISGLTDEETRALQLAVATVHLGEDWGGEALLKIGPSQPDPTAGGLGDRPIVAALPSSPSLPAALRRQQRAGHGAVRPTGAASASSIPTDCWPGPGSGT